MLNVLVPHALHELGVVEVGFVLSSYPAVHLEQYPVVELTEVHFNGPAEQDVPVDDHVVPEHGEQVLLTG